MLNNRKAETKHPVLDVIANRWSPYAYVNTPVEKEKIMSLLEAARWAASSYNEQPWAYIVGFNGDENFKKLASLLAEGNAWAKTVPVLMLSTAKKKFARNEKPNRHYMHDVGAASALMALEATELDLAFHQMAGFDVEKAITECDMGEDYEPGAMIAIGYYGDQDALSDDLKGRETAPRARKDMKDVLWKTEI